jgi:Cu/Ag efflux pump CusA
VLRNPGSTLVDGQRLKWRPPAPAVPRRGVCTATAASSRSGGMFLSEFSIKRPIATVVIIIGLMALGLLALSKLRVNQIPDVEQPVLTVGITYPGASPDTVEREVINRIEKALQGISRRRPGALHGQRRLCTHRAVFNFDKNMIEAADEVRNAIGSVRHKLPVEIREPVLQRLDPAAQPIMQMALVVHHAQPRRDLAPGRRPAGRPLQRHHRAWPWSMSTARCGAN